MLVLALFALWVQSGPVDWQSQGFKALDEKRYDAAVEAFQKAVAADPKDYGSLFNLALAQSMLHKDAEAAAGYRKVLELKPGLYEAELNLGILLLRDRQAADSIPFLKQAAQAKPKEFRPAYYLAEALLAGRQAPEAEQSYKAALELNPKSAPAEAGLARSLLEQDRLPEAAEHFHKAGELDPSYKDAILQLAETYEAKHQNAEALAIYQEFPENAGAQERAAQLLLAQGRSSEAIPRLEAAVKAEPTVANRMALATAYIEAKQFDKGGPLVAQALQAEPNNYDLRMMAGRLLRDQRKYPEAAAQFFQATKLKPASTEAWTDLSAVLVAAEQYPQALAALDRVKALGGEKPGHLFFRAISLDHLNQYQPALEAYQKFMAESGGKLPDEEFKARQRIRILQKEISKR